MIRAAAASAALILLAAAALPSIGEGQPKASRPEMEIRPDFSAVEVQPYDPPKPAPAFSLPDLDGKTWSLAEFRGKVLMLFFWATW